MRDWLKNLRIRNQKTQKEVAVELDISESYYNMIENGERQPDMNLSIMKRLSETFQVSLQFIVDEEAKLDRSMQHGEK